MEYLRKVYILIGMVNFPKGESQRRKCINKENIKCLMYLPTSKHKQGGSPSMPLFFNFNYTIIHDLIFEIFKYIL